MKEIILTQGKFALVDNNDFEFLTKWKWCYHGGYAVRGKNLGNHKTEMVYMHRIIMNIGDGDMKIDHKNHNGIDNQRINLRICSKKENAQNVLVHRDNKSGYKGVSWHKRKKRWTSSIRVDGKLLNLGYFSTSKEAAVVYDQNALLYFGEYANLNFK